HRPALGRGGRRDTRGGLRHLERRATRLVRPRVGVAGARLLAPAVRGGVLAALPALRQRGGGTEQPDGGRLNRLRPASRSGTRWSTSRTSPSRAPWSPRFVGILR